MFLFKAAPFVHDIGASLAEKEEAEEELKSEEFRTEVL